MYIVSGMLYYVPEETEYLPLVKELTDGLIVITPLVKGLPLIAYKHIGKLLNKLLIKVLIQDDHPKRLKEDNIPPNNSPTTKIAHALEAREPLQIRIEFMRKEAYNFEDKLNNRRTYSKRSMRKVKRDTLQEILRTRRKLEQMTREIQKLIRQIDNYSNNNRA